jgi:hypothetical protein
MPACSGTEQGAPARSTTVATTPAEAAVPQPADAAPASPADAPPPPVDAPPGPGDAGVMSSAAVGKGSVTVFAHFVNSKQAVPRFVVQLGRPQGFARGATTDANGRATFDDLEPGEYTVYWIASGGDRRTPPARLHKPVTVKAGAKVEVDVAVHSLVQDQPLVTPYGAPSVRWRLV